MFDYSLDLFYSGVCVDGQKCPTCGWKPRAEFSGMYAEWRMHFKGAPNPESAPATRMSEARIPLEPTTPRPKL